MTNYLKTANKASCYGCRACEKICPDSAVALSPDSEGFLYPVLDSSRCVGCGLCLKVCPFDNNFDEDRTPLKVYAAQYKNENALNNSSSGGIFSAVADLVLKEGGAVCGCIFNENFKTVHIVTKNAEEAEKMRGSKYVQSDTADTFTEIKRLLESGTRVLFTGTPCQVDGLKRFLLRDYDNLITIDLICHGVPSPRFFEEFLKDEERKNGKITDIRFRDKPRNGWRSQGSISFLKNGRKSTRVISPYNSSYYQLYYLADSISRMSCYSCKYASTNRVGDITIGDYWNVGSLKPEIAPEKGVSVLLVNSPLGEKLLNELGYSVALCETSLENAVANNGNLSRPSDMPKSRGDIYKRLEAEGYSAVAKQDCKYSYVMPFLKKHMPKRLKSVLKALLRRRSS